MENLSKFYIDGAWIEPSTPDTIPVINPATEREIGRVSIGGVDDVNRAVWSARRAFKPFSETSSRERIELLDRIIAGYKARHSDLVDAITAEIGAPARFTRQVQVGLALKHLEKARDLLKDYKFEYMLDGDIVRREALAFVV
jgi:aldehyde dehydrogenase (NAD+)